MELFSSTLTGSSLSEVEKLFPHLKKKRQTPVSKPPAKNTGDR
jgi:hypothetical protein